MFLKTKCKHCGETISRNSTTCPKCHHGEKKTILRHCRVCNYELDAYAHKRMESYSSTPSIFQISGSSIYALGGGGLSLKHVECPSCGEPEPLWNIFDLQIITVLYWTSIVCLFFYIEWKSAWYSIAFLHKSFNDNDFGTTVFGGVIGLFIVGPLIAKCISWPIRTTFHMLRFGYNPDTGENLYPPRINVSKVTYLALIAIAIIAIIGLVELPHYRSYIKYLHAKEALSRHANEK